MELQESIDIKEPFDIKELIDLINIRGYVVNSINNSAIDRGTVTEMNNTLMLLDRKIITLLKHPTFKNYIGYQDIKQVTKEIANINNIRSGMVR